MPRKISPLACVDARAVIGLDVEIGPFCVIGPHVRLGDGCKLDNQVTLTGHTEVGCNNRFFPGSVIGGEPQDIGYVDAPTRVEIGDNNIFREGVTVNRGAEKEDGVTRIGNNNFLMANSHVAHNCHVHNNAILCNGVLLGGHVHVQDWAIVSGNSVVHHFATVGTCAFLSGGCRCPTDLPPYMLAAGSDNPEVITVNLVGMRRRGIPEPTIQLVRQTQKLIFREHKKLEEVRNHFLQECQGTLPPELAHLLEFMELSARGKNGRAREVVRSAPTTIATPAAATPQRKAA